MTIAENIRLEQEMSIIRDPLDQTRQMTVNADGSISVSPVTGSVQVVSGAAAVGATPTVPPVGVSGIDGSGLKRSLLTDSIGQMMTTEQDSEVFTASASSASVLFTVDMSSWRSVLLQVTSAGTSCTVTYECSNDQSSWSSCTGIIAGASTTAGVTVANSTATSQNIFPKRAKYFRARVSVYGSGTVSVSYSLSLQDIAVASAASVWGQVAEGSTASGNPVTIGIECRTATKIAVTSGQVVRPIGTTDGRMVVKPHSVPQLEWSYTTDSSGIANTAVAVTIKSSTATLRHYITSIQISADALTNATVLAIRDGAAGTILWCTKIPTTGMTLTNVVFEDPIRGTANTLLEVVTLTASGTGAVYFNAQGYSAP